MALNKIDITDQQWATFDRDGYVVLKKVINSSTLTSLQSRIDAIMQGTADVPYDKLMMQLDSPDQKYANTGEQTMGFKGPTLDYRKIQNLDEDKIWMDYMRAPLFDEACKRIYGTETPITSFRCMFFNKPAGKGTPLPWHQDRWQYLTKDPLLTVWSALDDATEATGCVYVIPGSHKLGVVNRDHHSSFLTDQNVIDYCGEEKVAKLEMEAGDIALLHNWTIHRSGVNNSPNPRRAYSVNYMPADTVALCHEFEVASAKPSDLKQGGETMGKGSVLAPGGMSFPLIFDRK